MNSFIAFVLLVAVHMGAANFNEGNLLTFEDRSYRMPAACEDDTFCFIKDEKYPTDIIEKLLNGLPDLSILNPHNHGSLSIGDQLSLRQGCDAQDECQSNTTYVDQPIYYIIDEENMVRVVVQLEKKFEQIYNVQWCLKPGRITEDTTHFLKSSHILENFNIECVNTYMPYEFFVLNDDIKDEPELEIARVLDGIPVCCRCRISEF